MECLEYLEWAISNHSRGLYNHTYVLFKTLANINRGMRIFTDEFDEQIFLKSKILTSKPKSIYSLIYINEVLRAIGKRLQRKFSLKL
jgi:hypothetical protein